MMQDPDIRTQATLESARAAGLLGAARSGRISGRVPQTLIDAAKARAHISSDTELLEYALAKVAVEDDYGEWLVSQKGAIPPDIDLDF